MQLLFSALNALRRKEKANTRCGNNFLQRLFLDRSSLWQVEPKVRLCATKILRQICFELYRRHKKGLENRQRSPIRCLAKSIKMYTIKKNQNELFRTHRTGTFNVSNQGVRKTLDIGNKYLLFLATVAKLTFH